MTKILTILIYIVSLAALPAAAQGDFRVMTYNVENLFDTEDNPLKNDNEFLPEGNRHWTRGRYYHKLRQIAKVITAAGEWSTPALVGLCEVENDTVLTHLIHRTPLRKQQYRYCMTHGADTRGINTALLYQRDKFGYIGHREHPVVFTHKKHKHTRNILHAWGQVQTLDTLDVFVCHLPSRYGGEKESEADRFDAARTLRSLCDSLFLIRSHPQILIMGDFNDTPENSSITRILSAHPVCQQPSATALYNLYADPHRLNFSGTHKYQGEWSQLDQIIVSGNLMRQEARMHVIPESIRIFCPDFLLTEDKTWYGKRPARSYYGFKYEGGYSDHLPLITDFLLSLPYKD